MAAKRIALVGQNCVACGCCVHQCRLGALSAQNGVCAKVDAQKCVGCGKCAAVCPAGVIQIQERRAG